MEPYEGANIGLKEGNIAAVRQSISAQTCNWRWCVAKLIWIQ